MATVYLSEDVVHGAGVALLGPQVLLEDAVVVLVLEVVLYESLA